MQNFTIILALLLLGASLTTFILSFLKKTTNLKWLSVLGLFIALTLLLVPVSDYIYEAKSRTDSSSQTSVNSSDEDADISSSKETSVSETSHSSSSGKTFNPSDYEDPDFGAWNHDQLEQGKEVRIAGKVLQNMKNDSSYYLRVAIDDNYDKVIMVEVSSYIYENVIAENDNVTFYGLAKGLTSYKSTLGREITLPLMVAQRYVVNSYGK